MALHMRRNVKGQPSVFEIVVDHVGIEPMHAAGVFVGIGEKEDLAAW
jgi:hypothetical protein